MNNHIYDNYQPKADDYDTYNMLVEAHPDRAWLYYQIYIMGVIPDQVQQ